MHCSVVFSHQGEIDYLRTLVSLVIKIPFNTILKQKGKVLFLSTGALLSLPMHEVTAESRTICTLKYLPSKGRQFPGCVSSEIQ